MPAIANPEEKSALSGEGKQTVHRLEHMLMAPCCYTQTIDLHNSDIANTMRHEVVAMVAAGKRAEEIFSHYKAIYGEQILAVPDGLLGQAAYAVPASVAAMATSALGLVLWRFHQRKVAVLQTATGLPLTPAAESLRASIRRDTEW